MRRERAVALLSGGLDSTVSLAAALRELDIRLVLFFSYGQLAQTRERDAVVGIASYYGLPFREVDLGWLGPLSPAGMRLGGGRKPSSLEGLGAVWIPNRNGVFVNVAASFAESYSCTYVVTGFNSEEAGEFPDNSREYVARLNRCFLLSTRNGVRVVSYTQELSKREIVEMGKSLRAPLSIIWSCYKGGDLMCGQCPSCRRLRSALSTLPEEKRPHLKFIGS